MTQRPSTIGCPISPDRAARCWAPTPRAPPSSVANVLFKPLPRVPPERKFKLFIIVSSRYRIKVPHEEYLFL